ncbi:protein NYNRIN-like [Amblyomma americanum]
MDSQLYIVVVQVKPGPFPPAGPYRYCLIAIDRYTRWPEAWPLEGITAEDVALAFFAGWIARCRPPHCVTTDQGRQFESHLFRLLGLTIGFERSRTTSYHPCANGMIEHFHRQFKAAIMCHPDSTWLEAIPAVTLGLRATFKPDIQATPAKLV